MSRSLLDLFARLGARPYDWMYRRGAPWESGPRPVLVELCEAGRLTPEVLAPGRALDLGCGSGADSVFLAQRGFEVTGVDFSRVAIEKAERAAAEAGPARSPRFVVGDLLELPSADVPGPFDLIFDGGTIDDFPPAQRPSVVAAVGALARPGARLLMWCFHARLADLPRMSFSGASRWGAPPIEPDEVGRLFDAAWEIERVEERDPVPDSAVFLMTRRSG